MPPIQPFKLPAKGSAIYLAVFLTTLVASFSAIVIAAERAGPSASTVIQVWGALELVLFVLWVFWERRAVNAGAPFLPELSDSLRTRLDLPTKIEFRTHPGSDFYARSAGNRKICFVPANRVESLREELENPTRLPRRLFLIAHEVSHLVSGDSRRFHWLGFCIASCVSSALVAIVVLIMVGSPPLGFFLCWGVLIVFLVRTLFLVVRFREHVADYQGCSMLPDATRALRAFSMEGWGGERQKVGRKLLLHPPHSARVHALQTPGEIHDLGMEEFFLLPVVLVFGVFLANEAIPRLQRLYPLAGDIMDWTVTILTLLLLLNLLSLLIINVLFARMGWKKAALLGAVAGFALMQAPFFVAPLFEGLGRELTQFYSSSRSLWIPASGAGYCAFLAAWFEPIAFMAQSDARNRRKAIWKTIGLGLFIAVMWVGGLGFTQLLSPEELGPLAIAFVTWPVLILGSWRQEVLSWSCNTRYTKPTFSPSDWDWFFPPQVDLPIPVKVSTPFGQSGSTHGPRMARERKLLDRIEELQSDKIPEEQWTPEEKAALDRWLLAGMGGGSSLVLLLLGLAVGGLTSRYGWSWNYLFYVVSTLVVLPALAMPIGRFLLLGWACILDSVGWGTES